MGGDAASYASPSSPESCPASSEARATRTEWCSPSCMMDIFLLRVKLGRVMRRAIDFCVSIVAIDRCSAHMLVGVDDDLGL